MSAPDRRALLDRDHGKLSIRGQCRLLGIARSGVYRPAPANDDADAALMRRIDALFMAWPFLGSRVDIARSTNPNCKQPSTLDCSRL